MTDYGTPSPPDPENQGRWLAEAIRTVQTPATFLQWFGVGSMVFAALVVAAFLGAPETIGDWYYDQLVAMQKDQPVQERDPLPPRDTFVRNQQIQYVASAAVSLVCSFLIAFGGIRMRQFNGYGWAVTGSILAAIPFTNSCCCIGLPIGIWSLVILFGSDVRLAFTKVGEAGGLDAFEVDRPPRQEPPSRPIRLE